MLKNVKRLALAFCTSLLVIGCQTKDKDSKVIADPLSAQPMEKIDKKAILTPPAVIKMTEITQGEPPYRDFHVDITLTNRRKTTTWFIIPFYGNEPMPKDEMFPSLNNKTVPFQSLKYDGTSAGGKGFCTVVAFMGTKRFYAVRAKPNATIRLRDLKIASKRIFSKLEIWESTDLLVNSNRKLENWLPYGTMSESGADIPKGSNAQKLDYKDKETKIREDYPREVVKTIWVSPDDKWTIDVKQK